MCEVWMIRVAVAAAMGEPDLALKKIEQEELTDTRNQPKRHRIKEGVIPKASIH